MNATQTTVHGAGLGLRRTLLGPLAEHPGSAPTKSFPDFLEVAPENWLNIGGAMGRRFRELTERHPFICHGLSLNLGGSAPLDSAFVAMLKTFFREHGIRHYSEHLSYCADDGHLYDLMPIPFTEEAVQHTAARIRQVQDTLEQRISIENISYYAAPGQAMTEIDFLKAVLSEADCQLLLDVNNVYVNAVNHGYDARTFIDALPSERIAYLHVAGHYRESDDLIIDSHGAAVIDPVWQLLAYTYAEHGVLPTLLERDFNLPPLTELLRELATIRTQQQLAEVPHACHA